MTCSRNNNTNIVKRKDIDFSAINRVALNNSITIISRWLPDGKMVGSEYIVCNPKRNDRKAGSFRINIKTGKWADFATGDKGGDITSLAAYLFDLSQLEAAKCLSLMVGLGGNYDR